MHWNIGKLLYERKLENKHGSAVVKHLSIDLKQRYPDMGMSERNLWDMKRFYTRFHISDSKLRQAVAVLPWGHINTSHRMESMPHQNHPPHRHLNPLSAAHAQRNGYKPHPLSHISWTDSQKP